MRAATSVDIPAKVMNSAILCAGTSKDSGRRSWREPRAVQAKTTLRTLGIQRQKPKIAIP